MNGAPRPLTTAANGPRPSASPSPAATQGTTPNAPARPHARRRRPQTDPLRPPHRPLKHITKPTMSLTQMNQKKSLGVGADSASSDGSIPVDAFKHEYLSQGAIKIPLYATRRELKELRHHVMRLQSHHKVDVRDGHQFTPPIRLHRRDPRAGPSGANAKYEEEETKEDIEEIKERERQEMQREERRKIREENQAKIAPTGNTKKPQAAFQKKMEQKFRPDDTPEAKKRQLLRYEETLPWHLEDFDNKQTWVGTYESELSETHVMLTTNHREDLGEYISMAPMERWYRFNVKSKAAQNMTDDLETIEKRVKQEAKRDFGGSFFSNIEKRTEEKVKEANRHRGFKGVRTRVGGGADDEGRIQRNRGDDEDTPYIKREADADDIDFNHEEDFADDEEGLNGLFEGEENDVKETNERVKRDMLGAAFFDNKNEQEVYRQEEEEAKEAEEQRKLEKGLRKALAKREKQIDYIDSDRENPYESSSESETDSETERQRAKAEAERKAAEQTGKPAEANNKVPSGATTKGSNTPSGSSKPVDINKKKRPGSPNLSEASGNESSRKKHKKKHLKDVAKRGAASGSDSEITDAGKAPKPKPTMRVGVGGSPSGSPGGSRAGSPAAGSAGAASPVNGSRASSPTAAAAPQRMLPSAAEIHKALPAEGMSIQNLTTMFKGRVDKNNTRLFIRLVKAVSVFDKDKGCVKPLPQMPSEETINAVMHPQGQKPV